ncbi:MAG: hypothetical protein ABII81_10525 [Pseudomonadota bacterium]
MHIFDIIEAWRFSMERRLSYSGVIVRFDRSPTDRPNPSCSLNLRRGNHEIDVLIWESGAAELSVGSIDGKINQVHFDDVRNLTDFGNLLSKLVEFIDNEELSKSR